MGQEETEEDGVDVAKPGNVGESLENPRSGHLLRGLDQAPDDGQKDKDQVEDDRDDGGVRQQLFADRVDDTANDEHGDVDSVSSLQRDVGIRVGQKDGCDERGCKSVADTGDQPDLSEQIEPARDPGTQWAVLFTTKLCSPPVQCTRGLGFDGIARTG